MAEVTERDRELVTAEYREWLGSCGYCVNVELDDEDVGLLVRWERTLKQAREDGAREQRARMIDAGWRLTDGRDN